MHIHMHIYGAGISGHFFLLFFLFYIHKYMALTIESICQRSHLKKFDNSVLCGSAAASLVWWAGVCVCVCVCVCVERERERECARLRKRECVREWVYIQYVCERE